MAMELFNKAADEIFEEAGVDKTEMPEIWQQCVEILSVKMASLSHLGFSNKRFASYEKQKKSLVEDLKKMKQERE